MKAKLLVVDDEPIVLALCKLALSLRGFETVLAKNGADGLKLFAQHRQEIDLVLVNGTMSRASGIYLVREMFRLAPRTNVILMTGRDQRGCIPDDVRTTCFLLAKPFNTRLLIEVIEKNLLDHANVVDRTKKLHAVS